MKIALILPGTIWYAPYVHIYTRILKELGVEHEIISWNRDGQDGKEGIQYDVNINVNNGSAGFKESGIGLFNWFMKQTDPIGGFTGAIWTGVTTYTLAKAMEAALNENLTGLYNLVNNESINKFDLCSLFNKYFRNGEVEINPNDKLQLDKTLKCTRTDFSFQVPSYEQQIKEMREWIDAHRELYPHYNVK